MAAKKSIKPEEVEEDSPLVKEVKALVEDGNRRRRIKIYQAKVAKERELLGFDYRHSQFMQSLEHHQEEQVS